MQDEHDEETNMDLEELMKDASEDVVRMEHACVPIPRFYSSFFTLFAVLFLLCHFSRRVCASLGQICHMSREFDRHSFVYSRL